jgi:diaminopimelate epimerase
MIARTPLVVPFTKMNGAGNDFVVLDNRFLHFSDDELAALARRFCPRRTGVGADGLLALDEPEGGSEADFRMRYRNADGSLGTMCGNGARCLARFAARAGLGVETEGVVHLAFDTDGGPYRARVEGYEPSGPVELDVPPPRDFGPAAVEGGERVLRIWTGTEHAVVFTPDVETADVVGAGPRLRRDPAFEPAGANVNFVEVLDAGARARVRVRTFEKGVEAETLACGTGAMASALVARLDGRVGDAGRQTVAVEMPGGTLTVGFRVDGDAVSDLTLAGPAETVYEGTLAWAG